MVGKCPFEKEEISNAMPRVLEALKLKLEAWKKATGSELPRSNPDYIGNNN